MRSDDIVYEINFAYRSGKFAIFDLETAIITTKSGRDRPKRASDWKFINGKILQNIRKIYSQRFDVIFITEQEKIISQSRADYYGNKIRLIFKKIGIKGSFFIITKGCIYKKPTSTCFDILCAHSNFKINYEKSFYCGPKAGRKTGWKCIADSVKICKQEDDESLDDLYFATNCNIRFCVPEMVFSKSYKGDEITLPKRDYGLDFDTRSDGIENMFDLDVTSKYVIVIVGQQMSGRTYLANRLKEIYYGDIDFDIADGTGLSNFDVIEKFIDIYNQDRSIIIDAHNFRKKFRKKFVDRVRGTDYKTMCVNIVTPLDMRRKLCHFKQMFIDPYCEKIEPDKIVDLKFDEVSDDEGFDNIVQYKPCIHFDSKVMDRISKSQYC